MKESCKEKITTRMERWEAEIGDLDKFYSIRFEVTSIRDTGFRKHTTAAGPPEIKSVQKCDYTVDGLFNNRILSVRNGGLQMVLIPSSRPFLSW